MAIHIGQMLGNYKLTRLLGIGAFGEVYLGENIHIGNQVAVKVLSGKFSPQDLQNFEDEARIVGALVHPHIARLLDFGKFDAGRGKGNEIPFMVMEFAANGTLDDRHPSGTQVPLFTVVSYVKQIADALQYAHDHKIVHRDIKPKNIFVRQNNEILVGDFGIAVAAHRTQTMQLQVPFGTPVYAAPEQFKGLARPASDQYALGVTVCEWLSGMSPPFPQGLKLPAISPAVEQVVFKAIEKDYKQRYPRIQDFAEALEKASNPTPKPTVVLPQIVIAPVPPVSPPIQQQPGLPPRETLYREGILAQSAGDIERAAALWEQALSNQGWQPHTNRRDSLDGQLSSLLREIAPQRIALKIQQAQEAKSVGNWQQEIDLWRQVIVLQQNHHLDDRGQIAREYLDRATKNLEYRWLYEHAQQLINNGRRDEAKAALLQLWRFAPYYGDPSRLAKKAGTHVPLDPSSWESMRSLFLPISLGGMALSGFMLFGYIIAAIILGLFGMPVYSSWYILALLGIFIIFLLLWMFTKIFLDKK